MQASFTPPTLLRAWRPLRRTLAPRAPAGRRLATALLLVGLGLAAGRWIATRELRIALDASRRGATLGGLLDDEQRQAVSAAYLDGAAIMPLFDQISWAPAAVPTPFLGHGPWPGQRDNARVDADQFRSAVSLARPKPAGGRRVLVTGGSVAWGSGAPSQERTIGGLLERRLAASTPFLEVATLAYPGWTTTHERILIENRLSELEPDVVVSVSGVNDVFAASRGRDVLWYRSFPDELHQELLTTVYELCGQQPPPDVVTLGDGPVAPAVVAERLVKNVRLAHLALADVGAEYVFALQPLIAVGAKPLAPREAQQREQIQADAAYWAACYEAIDARLSEQDLPGFTYLRLTDAFDELDADTEVYLDSCHLGDRGNDLLARRLALALAPLLAE